MLQESFIQIFSQLDTYEFRGSFEGWLAKITVRTSINHLKSKLGKWNAVLASEEPLNIEGGEIDYIERETLGELVAMLPPGMRAIFNLNVIEGYNHNEISETMNISESSSRAQLARARARLKELFQKSNLS